MKEITLHTGETTSRIMVGESISNILEYLPDSRLVIITDKNVAGHYSDSFPEGIQIIVDPGESSKTIESTAQIYGELISREVDRGSFLLGIGGGIVCDLAGYIAATYLRGIRFGFVSTTLLSQVDASIGGKNGVNYEGYKNMIGTIRQPEFVICDPELLNTLDPDEFRMGFAEVVKYGAIMDKPLLSLLERKCQKAIERDPGTLAEIIGICVSAKCTIVAADEKESGERKKLNFGHTFAHAFEKSSGLPHGEAVSIGMVMAARLSEKLGMIDNSSVTRLMEILERLGLPVSWKGSGREIFGIMKRDKKRGGDSISLILLESIGNAVIKDVKLTDLNNWIDDLCSPF